MTINEKKQLSNYIKGLVRESLGEMDSMPSWYNKENHGFGDEEEYDDFKDGFENDEISGGFDDYPAEDDGDDFWDEYGHEQPGRHYEGPDVDGNDDPVYDKDEIAGLNELRRNDSWKKMKFNGEEERPYKLSNKEKERLDKTMSKKHGNEEAENDDESAELNELRQLAESYARSAVKSILMEKKKKSKSKKTKKRKNKKEKTSSRDKTVLDFFKSDGVNKAAYAYDLYNAKTDDEKASARSKFYKQLYGKKNDTGVPYKFKSQQIAHLANRRNKKIKVQ